MADRSVTVDTLRGNIVGTTIEGIRQVAAANAESMFNGNSDGAVGLTSNGINNGYVINTVDLRGKAATVDADGYALPTPFNSNLSLFNFFTTKVVSDEEGRRLAEKFNAVDYPDDYKAAAPKVEEPKAAPAPNKGPMNARGK